MRRSWWLIARMLPVRGSGGAGVYEEMSIYVIHFALLFVCCYVFLFSLGSFCK